MSKAFLLWLSLLTLACFFSRSVKGASEGAAFNSCRSTTKLCVVRERCEVLDCQFTLDSPKQGKGPGFYILHENNTICSMVPGSKISKYAWILFQVSLSGHSDSDRETFVYECMRKDERSTRYLCDKRVAVYFLTLRQMPQLSIGEADERTGNGGQWCRFHSKTVVVLASVLVNNAIDEVNIIGLFGEDARVQPWRLP